MTMTHEEEQEVNAGQLAQTLMANAGWPVFVELLEQIQKRTMAQAMQQGDTDYQKGLYRGLQLALEVLPDSISRMKEILNREEAFSADATPAYDSEPDEEKAP